MRWSARRAKQAASGEDREWKMTLPDLVGVLSRMLAPVAKGEHEAMTCADLLHMLGGMDPVVPIRIVYGEGGANMQVQAVAVFVAEVVPGVSLASGGRVPPFGLMLGPENAVMEAAQILSLVGTKTPRMVYGFDRAPDGCATVASVRDLLHDFPEDAGAMEVLIVGRAEPSGDPVMSCAYTVCHNIPGMRGAPAPGEYEHICLTDHPGLLAMQARGSLVGPATGGGEA